MQSLIRPFIVIFFTAAFLVPRVTILHSLSHLSDDDVHNSCDLCDILVYSYQLDSKSEDTSYVTNEFQDLPNSFVVLYTYNISQEKIVSPDFIYNKPPPLF
jgi:hypothetical protein